ncbi:ribosome assembly protein noc2 [Neofusicoccum parvum]|uniref:Putative ribosome assembly protein noc2 protein n=1 Tax=Botryosphaeria parva (strain UCR-NP2) TaxID=1287680 RepID=R1E7D4_BOTPV|nr:putative ribosome assembly protein noc2 protein [Neofusicoccum parvum UCRNP2]GME36430.1 ribosome assembly protein noc2 [Neofusicoccum parvum]
MAQSKSTKKFEKNHLKDTLKRRKEGKKIKQRVQIKEKRKARRAEDNEVASDVEAENKAKRARQQEDANPFGDMTVDDFFQGGFDIPEEPKPKKQKKQKDVPSKTGKRKRTEPAASDDEDAAALSDDSIDANPVADDSGSEAESDGDIDAHKKQLEELKKKDPEFYKFMKENDPELLDFAEDADLAEIDELSGSEAEETPKKKQKKEKKKSKKKDDSDDEVEDMASNEVTKALVKKWSTAMAEKHSLRATKEVVLAFRAAAHLNEEDGKEYKYAISNPDVYHELLVLALNRVPEVLQHHLPVKESNNGKVRVHTEGKKYSNMTPMLKSHATSVMHLLGSLSDAATLRMTLTSLVPLLPYILSFKKLVRDMAKTVVSIWADSSNGEASRIAAFLVLRRLIVIGDAGIKEATLKAVYQGFVQGSRNTTIHTIAGVNLMKNSAAELWGLDPNIGYTTGFTFIRQLAIHLRSSITNKSKESYKTVYNWQYVHSLDFWSRVVSSHCDTMREAESGKESPLRPLIYPIVQVSMGAMRLIPTAQYFPLRFQIIRALLRITLSTSTYIPIAPALYEVLNSAEMRKPPKPATLKPIDFPTSIRAPKTYLRTRVYQDGVGEQVAELLAEFFVLWSKNIAFPELALPVLVMLKRWVKDVSNKTKGNKNSKVNTAIGLIIQKLETNTRWIEERRAKVEFAPNNRAGVEGFLKEVEWEKTPLGAYVVGQRKTREEKARLIEEGRKEEEKKKQEERAEKEKERRGEFEGFEEDDGEESGSDGDDGDEMEVDGEEDGSESDE